MSVLPALSRTVTVAVAAAADAAAGVPSIAPLAVSMLSPGGNPVAPYSSMPVPPEAVIRAIATPTLSEPGAVYAGGVGALRSTVRVRSTAPAAV